MAEQENKKIPLPEGKKVIGIIDELVGWAHARVRCFDGKTRICRVPKRISKKIWLKRGEYVLVDPWEIEGDRKGDIIHIYSKSEVEWLRKNGYLEVEEEF